MDPLRDPRFPDRPQHPDFWRIAEVSLRKDGASKEGHQTIEEIIASLVDLKSLDYAALVRMHKALVETGFLDQLKQCPNDLGKQYELLMSILAGAWTDAFTTGVLFQQAGGHQ